MKKYIACLLCLIFTACASTADTKKSAETTSQTSSKATVPQIAIESSETAAEEIIILSKEAEALGDEVLAAVTQKKKALDETDYPFLEGVYGTDMFDYNNDGNDDFVILFGVYSQFEFVIFDSQNGDILFDKRIIMATYDVTEIKIYSNSDSGYMFKITGRRPKDVQKRIEETIQFDTESENYSLEAVYNLETGKFSHAYDIYADEEGYIQKQEEILSGYDYVADLSVGNWTIYWDCTMGT